VGSSAIFVQAIHKQCSRTPACSFWSELIGMTNVSKFWLQRFKPPRALFAGERRLRSIVDIREGWLIWPGKGFLCGSG
jgi:hypothetical protein